jgi:predicted  nucleic acid-binding Zn-ribbon protein
MSEKTIDYLFEDPEIPNQKFALISIVGPHMKQKCDVWGLKIRGVSDTLEKAKTQCQKLLRIDNDYDIYTVEVGKFFPLTVEPNQISDVEYENKQLNTLVKSYLENKESANELWHKRKAEMIQNAIKEGQNQEEFSNKPEHSIAVLYRIRDHEQTISELEGQLKTVNDRLEKARGKFNGYTDAEKSDALSKIENEHITSENKTEIKVDELRLDESINVETIIEKLKKIEVELEEMTSFQASISETSAPSAYKRISQNIFDLQKEITSLKHILNDKNLINQYINNNYKDSQYKFD